MRRIILAAVLGALATGAASGREISGPIAVVDGDTVRVAGQPVRLFGIDAPEARQTCDLADGRPWACGAWATGRMRALSRGGVARCTVLDRDRYGRHVARCHIDGADIGARLVAEGAARAYRRYSMDYVGLEGRARREARGLWRGHSVPPAQFRAAGVVTRNHGCAIKGNLSRNGRIYHLPGQEFYDRTRITPDRGERWFCNEAEARRAGWRPARR